jgi:hypothetical protein
MKNIISKADLLTRIPRKGNSYLLLYKPDNENSICSYSNIDDIATDDFPVFSADVSLVRDIHTAYGVDSVPSLLIFEDGEFRNVIKGCHESRYYESLFNNDFYMASETEIKQPPNAAGAASISLPK